MLSYANKPFMPSAVILNVVMPSVVVPGAFSWAKAGQQTENTMVKRTRKSQRVK